MIISEKSIHNTYELGEDIKTEKQNEFIRKSNQYISELIDISTHFGICLEFIDDSKKYAKYFREHYNAEIDRIDLVVSDVQDNIDLVNCSLPYDDEVASIMFNRNIVIQYLSSLLTIIQKETDLYYGNQIN